MPHLLTLYTSNSNWFQCSLSSLSDF